MGEEEDGNNDGDDMEHKNLEIEDNSNQEEAIKIDNLPPIEKVEYLTESSNIVDRMSFVRDINFFAKTLGFETTLEIIIPKLKTLLNDPEDGIKIIVVEQICEFSNTLISIGKDEGYTCILNNLIPLLKESFQQDNPEMRESGVDMIIEISKILKKKKISINIFCQL